MEDIAQTQPLLKHRHEILHLFWLHCKRMVSLKYLDQEVLTVKGWRVEDRMRDRNINKEKGTLPIKQDKGRGKDRTAGTGRECEDFVGTLWLKPKISFCGLYFWVIMSSSPSRTCAHIPLFCLTTINRAKLWRVKSISLCGIHLLENEWENYRKFHNQGHISLGPCKPGTVSMGHATWEHFWKTRKEQSEALGIIRHLWQLAKVWTLEPDRWKVYGGALARLEVTKQNGKILCVLSPTPEVGGVWLTISVAVCDDAKPQTQCPRATFSSPF